jgi:hypothetical protein
MVGSAVSNCHWRYGVILLIPMALEACQEPNNLLPPFETAPANGLSDRFRACVSREAVAVVQRVSSRGPVALMARHDEMNWNVAGACNAKGRILQPDEVSYIAMVIDHKQAACGSPQRVNLWQCNGSRHTSCFLDQEKFLDGTEGTGGPVDPTPWWATSNSQKVSG